MENKRRKAMIVCPDKYQIHVEYPTSFVKEPATEGQYTHCMIIPGLYERELIDWAREFVDQNSNFVDLGAHIGSWSLILSKHVKTVFAFEAQRMIYYQLCGNIAMNDLTNVHAYHTGLGSREQQGQEIQMLKYGTDYGSSSIHSATQAKYARQGTEITGTEKIRMACLDDYELQNVSLMKLDVQGCELDILKGATDLLIREKPTLILEVEEGKELVEQKTALFTWLAANNYDICPITGWPEEFLAIPTQHKLET